jgi:hypothetical protein
MKRPHRSPGVDLERESNMLDIVHLEDKWLIVCQIFRLMLSCVQHWDLESADIHESQACEMIHQQPERVSHMAKAKLYSEYNTSVGVSGINHLSSAAIPLACHPK